MMKVKRMEVVKRDDGYFHYMNGKRVKAYYPKRGYAVMIVYEESPVDLDFGEKVWFPTAEELRRLADLMDESDKLTYELLGHGWEGKRPYHKLEEFV
jgi:hypothetical protein